MNKNRLPINPYWLRVILLLFVSHYILYAQDLVLLQQGAVWKYEDSGTDLGTAWQATSFDDNGWASGPAMLGFDEDEVVTEITQGHITYYFRTNFTLSESPDSLSTLELLANFDDGFVAYINGQEVTRGSMPSGPITYNTYATSHESGDFESFDISNHRNALVQGNNVIAVEVHQRGSNNNDLAIDIELVAETGSGGSTGGGALGLERGPYLQMGSPNSIIVRWRTANATDSRVLYGADPDNLSTVVDASGNRTEHEVELTGLQPNQIYYYGIGNTSEAIISGPDFHFKTAPASGNRQKTRIWVLGDSGTADEDAAAVRDAYYAFTGDTFTDLWVMLGDNAYSDGEDDEYQEAVFEMYPEMLKKSVLWPAFGNHDGKAASSDDESGPFYEIFSLPRNGEIGGTASGTEAYYSFDYANIHFICLNSHDVDRDETGPMLNWLTQDLAQNTRDWTIAFWHHPPYTKGSHDSDDEEELIEMRENALPILEAGGVDLVLSGHSHSYERSYLMDGHYGMSNTLNNSMLIDDGDGRESGDGIYMKPTLGPAANEGAVYIVAGSSGKTSDGSLDHPAMYYSVEVLGSVVLDVNYNQMQVTFIDDDGATQDYFTMQKGDVLLSLTTQMASFAGDVLDDGALLRWQTRMEGDNAGFEIYRTSDLSQDFEKIASYVTNPTLKGQGDSEIPHDYQFRDVGLVNGLTYWYRIAAVDVRGNQTLHGPIRIEFNNDQTVLVSNGILPETLQLQDNYPNPFNPETTIRFDLPANSDGAYEVQLTIFDITGRKVKSLVSGKYAPGSYALHWDATNDRGDKVPSGIYIYSMRTAGQYFAKRMTFVQ